MARIRTIKPEFWTSEQIVECSPIARLLFVGLWNFCDDAGRHPASFARAKMEVFPSDSFTLAEVSSWVDELVSARLIIAYTVADKDFWQVTGWHHQKIDRPNFKYPQPPKFDECSTSARRSIAPVPVREGKGCLKEKITSPSVFPEFWKAYPQRNGRKVGRKQAASLFGKLSTDDQQAAILAATNYAAECGAFAKDPQRFLQADFWRDWVAGTTSASRVATADDLAAWRPTEDGR